MRINLNNPNNNSRINFGIVHFVVLAFGGTRVNALSGVLELRGLQGLHDDHLGAVVQGRGLQVVDLDDLDGLASSAGVHGFDDLDVTRAPAGEKKRGRGLGEWVFADEVSYFLFYWFVYSVIWFLFCCVAGCGEVSQLFVFCLVCYLCCGVWWGFLFLS